MPKDRWRPGFERMAPRGDQHGEPIDQGDRCGDALDPRKLSGEELAKIGVGGAYKGHFAMSPMEVIRAKCIDCSGGSYEEVRLCACEYCPLWPFRMGKNPWRAAPSEAQREAARKMAASRQNQRSAHGSDEEKG
jgi:hypothetical protein